MAAVVTGTGCICNLAASPAQLYDRIARGDMARYQTFFNRVEEAYLFGLSLNPLVNAPDRKDCLLTADIEAALANRSGSLPFVCHSLAAAIADAGLAGSTGWQARSRLYLGAAGNELDMRGYLHYAHRNDYGEYRFRSALRGLHVDNFRMAPMIETLGKVAEFAEPATTVFSTCATGMAALYLAVRAIQAGDCDRAIVATWQPIDLNQLIYLNGSGLLAQEISAPFCHGVSGVAVALGAGVIVIENEHIAAARGAVPYFRISGMATRRSVARSETAASAQPDPRGFTEAIMAALQEARLDPSDIQVVMAHANGNAVGDLNEGMALRSTFAATRPPVITYKRQTGYFLGSSGVFDLVMLAESFRRQQLVRFSSPRPPDVLDDMNFFHGKGAEDVELRRAIKISRGLEGSIYALVAEDVRKVARCADATRNGCGGAAANREVYLLGSGLAEPVAEDILCFVPRLDNYYERLLSRRAARASATRQLRVGAFRSDVSGSLRRGQPRAAAQQTAFDQAIAASRLPRSTSRTSLRIGLIYVDGQGAVSWIRQTMGKDEGFLLDTFPTMLTKRYLTGGYSARMRGDRTVAIHAIALACDLIRQNELDNVIIGGLFQLAPALALTDAIAQRAWEASYFGKTRAPLPDSLILERSLFVVLGCNGDGAAARLAKPDYLRLPKQGVEARQAWIRQWRAAAQDTLPDDVFCGMGGVGESGSVEAELLAEQFPGAAVTRMTASYGDSGELNPLLALHKIAVDAERRGHRRFMINAFDRGGDSWCLVGDTGRLQ
jgi:3-oxoacyl-(acyl-carrier-protein) synthase